MKNLFFAILTVLSLAASAQQGVFQPGDYKDGIYDKENAVNRRFIPYTHLREGDVTWEKRVWRDVDMREKINQPLYYPVDYDNITSRMSMFQVLAKYILQGQVIAFNDEQFQIPLELSAIRDKLKKCDSADQTSYTPEGEEVVVKIFQCDSLSILRQIRTFRLKEDWFFDKQKSVLEVRIIGMGVFTYDDEKEALREQFWVYFPSIRPFFAKHEVFNTKNDSERRTFEDIFWKRQFASTITKETNVYGRNINEYSRGIDALLESDRIKMDIFRWEHDLWHF
ncbi:MAG: gliding motility protein GldN [Bacteroidota bacterium]|nr:gliding motility protein GldN [Bacteroidota bacterium]